MKKIFIFIITLFLLWIGFTAVYSKAKTFDGSEESLSRMMSLLPLNQQADFLKDFELVAEVYGGEYKLLGFKIEDIKSESIKINKWINKQNIIFLEAFIKKLSDSNKNSTYLHMTNIGLMQEPQMGYNYKTKYSLQDLKNLLKELKNNI